MVPSARAPISLARYDYFNGDRPTDANGFPLPVRTIDGVRLSSGLTVRLPSRGLVVLSSTATGGAITLHEGSRGLVAQLSNWHKAAAHTNGLRLDHSARQRFNATARARSRSRNRPSTSSTAQAI